MIRQNSTDEKPANERLADENHPRSDAELRATLPIQVKEQPDPFLQMSTGGRMGVGGITLFTLAVVVILSVVLYGLNDRSGAAPPNAAAPPHAAAAGGTSPAPKPTASQTTNNAKG